MIKELYVSGTSIRNTLLFVAAFFGISIVICAGVTVLAYQWLQSNDIPVYEPEHFIVGSPAFPRGWTRSAVGRNAYSDRHSDYGFLAAEAYFHSPSEPSSAYQKILQFSTTAQAHQEFILESELWFGSEADMALLENDAAVISGADEYRFKCVKDSPYGGPRCVMIARYDRYFSAFWIKTDGKRLSNGEIQQIVTAIDQRFTGCDCKTKNPYY